MLQRSGRWEISFPTTQCVLCLIKHVECMFGIVWPPPKFQHVALSNMQPTCCIVQHLSFGRALSYKREMHAGQVHAARKTSQVGANSTTTLYIWRPLH